MQFDESGFGLYVPAEHARHATPVWPWLFRGQKPALHVQFVMAALPTGDHEFAKHEVHCDAPSGEYVLAGHSRQFSVVVPPTEYRPGPHVEHACALPKLNFPTPHATHVLPGVLSLTVKKPALHLQASIEILPLANVVEFPTHAPHEATDVCEFAAWYFPTGQFVHAASPSVSLYVPAPQYPHEPPFGPVYPRSHMHISSDVELTVGVVLKLAGQTVHGCEPASGLYDPTAHPVHTVAPPGNVKPALQTQFTCPIATVLDNVVV